MTEYKGDHSAHDAEKASESEGSSSAAEKAESNTGSIDYRQKYEEMRAHSRTWDIFRGIGDR